MTLAAHRAAIALELGAILMPLKRFAMSLTRDAAERDDLVQETLLKIWRHADKFEPGTGLRQWAFTIMRRIHIDLFRRKARMVIDTHELPDDVTIEPVAEIRVFVQEVVKHLEAAHGGREMVLYGYGLNYDEIAHKTGNPTNTVRSRISRARAQARQHLAA